MSSSPESLVGGVPIDRPPTPYPFDSASPPIPSTPIHRGAHRFTYNTYLEVRRNPYFPLSRNPYLRDAWWTSPSLCSNPPTEPRAERYRSRIPMWTGYPRRNTPSLGSDSARTYGCDNYDLFTDISDDEPPALSPAAHRSEMNLRMLMRPLLEDLQTASKMFRQYSAVTDGYRAALNKYREENEWLRVRIAELEAWIRWRRNVRLSRGRPGGPESWC